MGRRISSENEEVGERAKGGEERAAERGLLCGEGLQNTRASLIGE